MLQQQCGSFLDPMVVCHEWKLHVHVIRYTNHIILILYKGFDTITTNINILN